MNHTSRIADVAKLERQRAKLLAQERRQRGQWHWLSFVNRNGFLGGAIVWAHGIETAVLRVLPVRRTYDAKVGKSGLLNERALQYQRRCIAWFDLFAHGT